jgi:hypothetical protein
MVFSRRKVKDVRLKIYSQNIGRVSECKYLGMWFDERLHVEEPC